MRRMRSSVSVRGRGSRATVGARSQRRRSSRKRCRAMGSFAMLVVSSVTVPCPRTHTAEAPPVAGTTSSAALALSAGPHRTDSSPRGAPNPSPSVAPAPRTRNPAARRAGTQATSPAPSSSSPPPMARSSTWPPMRTRASTPSTSRHTTSWDASWEAMGSRVAGPCAETPAATSTDARTAKPARRSANGRFCRGRALDGCR
jgi:hypothetical protein